MKNLTLLSLFLLITGLLSAQNDSKTLVKTIDPIGASEVLFDFKYSKLESKTWNNNTVRLQLEVRSNMPEPILNQLVKSGRYTLEGSKNGSTYTLKAPNLAKQVTIGGKALQEEIILHVEMPESMKLSQNILSFKSSGQKFGTEISFSVKTVCTDPALAAEYASKSKQENKMSATVAKPRSGKKSKSSKEATAPASGMSENQELKARFGEILIDGVKFEVE